VVTARKWVAAGFGGPEVLRNIEADVPDPGLGEVTISVRACGMNPADAKHVARGQDPGLLPLSIGYEVAGVVQALGPDTELASGGGAPAYRGRQGRRDCAAAWSRRSRRDECPAASPAPRHPGRGHRQPGELRRRPAFRRDSRRIRAGPARPGTRHSPGGHLRRPGQGGQPGGQRRVTRLVADRRRVGSASTCRRWPAGSSHSGSPVPPRGRSPRWPSSDRLRL
jgi:hypothetical protein